MICKNCQKEIKDNAKFCNFCGYEQKIKKSLFSGRINRRNYFIGYIILTLILFIPWTVIVFISTIFGIDYQNSVTAGIILLIMYVIYSIYSLSFSIKRVHDLGHSGWILLVGIIPIVNLILLIIMVFERGSETSNKYGNKPLSKIDMKEIFGFNPKI